jgi:hypothetical protein
VLFPAYFRALIPLAALGKICIATLSRSSISCDSSEHFFISFYSILSTIRHGLIGHFSDHSAHSVTILYLHSTLRAYSKYFTSRLAPSNLLAFRRLGTVSQVLYLTAI